MVLSYFCELSWLVQLGLVTLAILASFKVYLVATLGVCTSTNRLDGKTVVITGANTGIGKETALDLAGRGAKVILACRNLQKANAAREEIIARSGNTNVFVKELDLASFKSVRQFAANILKSEPHLDILINNAGCAGLDKKLTEDGLEYQMQSNHFGHFLLTNLLLGLLKSSAPSRIINVSSMGHGFTNELDLSNLNSEIKHNVHNAYHKSKLCQVLVTRYLAPLIAESGVSVNSLCPGAVKGTYIFRNSSLVFRFLFEFAFTPFFKTTKEGAQTTIHLAVADEVANITGEYFSDCKIAKTSKLGRDDGLAKKLWEISETLVKLQPEEKHF